MRLDFILKKKKKQLNSLLQFRAWLCWECPAPLTAGDPQHSPQLPLPWDGGLEAQHSCSCSLPRNKGTNIPALPPSLSHSQAACVGVGFG